MRKTTAKRSSKPPKRPSPLTKFRGTDIQCYRQTEWRDCPNIVPQDRLERAIRTRSDVAYCSKACRWVCQQRRHRTRKIAERDAA